jgi:hypothetical protein
MRRQDIPGASELDAIERCGLVRKLRVEFPTNVGRAAIIGTAFHAAIAGLDAPEPLTKEETDQVAEWVSKTTHHSMIVGQDWKHEVPVGLDSTGCWCEYDSPRAITCGTCDAYCIRESMGSRVIVVLDWKTGRNPQLDDYQLQLAAYALALAEKHACDYVEMGIFCVQRQCWEHYAGQAADSEFMGDLWARVQSAAQKEPVACVGPHCAECYQRGVCPARLLPAGNITALEPFSQPHGLTLDNIVKAQCTVEAMADIVERAKEAIRAFVLEQGGAVSLGNGKELAIVDCAGRETADLKALREAGLGQYIKRGNAYHTLKVRKEVGK